MPNQLHRDMEKYSIKFVPLEKENLPWFLHIRNNCTEFLHTDKKFSLEEASNWFSDTAPEYYIIQADCVNVGYFRTSNLDRLKRTIYIGCDLQPEYRGRGIGYQAYSEFIKYMGQKYKLKRILLEVLETNRRAIGLYEKLGFKQTGLRKSPVVKNGKEIESIEMELITY